MTKYIFQDSNLDVDIGKIICLARTYKKHAREMNAKITEKPVLFLKPNSSVIFNNESVIKPKMSDCLHHELELGVVIGKDGKNISEKNAMDYVLGYCAAIDITARDIQTEAKKKALPWGIAKGFDTFAPISYVILKDKILNPNNLDLILKLNGEIKQKSNTKYMIFSIKQIINFVSQIMTLKRGDLILTGTPEGVGEIKKGDIIEANLNNKCFLRVNVK